MTSFPSFTCLLYHKYSDVNLANACTWGCIDSCCEDRVYCCLDIGLMEVWVDELVNACTWRIRVTSSSFVMSPPATISVTTLTAAAAVLLSLHVWNIQSSPCSVVNLISCKSLKFFSNFCVLSINFLFADVIFWVALSDTLHGIHWQPLQRIQWCLPVSEYLQLHRRMLTQQ